MHDPAEAIRHAATVILWRQGAQGPEVLMGQRGAGALFMPSKYVFPGGAVDAEDHGHPPILALTATCAAQLGQHVDAAAPSPATLLTAALRELDEETGLRPASSASVRFVFRAITPPGRTRRFDARFFLISGADLIGDATQFSGASGELTHLHWIGLAEARALDLPFVTEVVLAEASQILRGHSQPGVPFFDNSGPVPTFRRLV